VIRVQQEDFDVGAEIKALTKGNPSIGGVVSFIGLVREIAGDRSIDTMALEHYPGMTEKMLARIEEEAQERWNLDASLIIHRYGPLNPGDQIVLTITASAHRQDAFEANEFLMDWLKTKAPFWKREAGADGDNWVEAKDSDDVAAARWNP
jgi:molybdopterin synthase catalytic subunit